MCTLIHTGCECIKSPIVLSCRHLAGAGISKDEHIKDADLISKKQFYEKSK